MDSLDLPLVWAGLIAFAVIAYVILDGFDLGIALLFPFEPEEDRRSQMMNAIAPVWDGNETWLVLGGGGLLAAFPLAYAILMPAFYAPLLAMLLGLIFRGVAFEFRFRTKSWRGFWDWGFFLGSVAATFAQGVVLGTYLQGIKVEGRAYAGGWWDWFTPFSLFCGVALLVGYATLGAAFIVMKTEGPVAARMQARLIPFYLLTLLCCGIVSVWTPFISEAVYARWFTWPNILYFSPVPVLVALLSLAFVWAVRRGAERLPFFLALGLFVLSFAGLGISLWPDVVPGDFTIWQAASPDKSLAFLLVGAAFLVPLILAYTAYAYWVFRGKVDPNAGYH
ncbi:MAG: cytochrome d ubiquinol oxidase subunit II [Geminicoccaceae bacterium]|nr:cytochrome d ubiquinol oxidase subunit II [Geminicoccaceae bacterium]